VFGQGVYSFCDFNGTLKHAQDLDTDIAYFLLVRAYPGTSMYNDLVRQGKPHTDLQQYTHLQGQVAPQSLDPAMRNYEKYNICNTKPFANATNKQLIDMLRKAYKLYYTDGRRRSKK
jgi:hypothetical protein